MYVFFLKGPRIPRKHRPALDFLVVTLRKEASGGLNPVSSQGYLEVSSVPWDVWSIEALLRLMDKILHHLGWLKPYK